MSKAPECVCPCHRKGMACPFACCGPGHVTSAIDADGRRHKLDINRFDSDFERVFGNQSKHGLVRRGYIK